MKLNWAHGMALLLMGGAYLINQHQNQETERKREETRKELALAYATLTQEEIERATESLRNEIQKKVVPTPYMIRVYSDYSLSNVSLVSYNTPFSIGCSEYGISFSIPQDIAYVLFSDYEDVIPFEMASVAGKQLQAILCETAAHTIHDIFSAEGKSLPLHGRENP